MKRILGRCALWTVLVVEILSAVWLAIFLLRVTDTRVSSSVVRYLPEGAEVIEEWQREDGTEFLAVQIPQDSTGEFVRVLEEEDFEKIEMWNYFPRRQGEPPRVVENGMWYEDFEIDDAYESRPAYHVYDLDTGIYYYIVTER